MTSVRQVLTDSLSVSSTSSSFQRRRAGNDTFRRRVSAMVKEHLTSWEVARVLLRGTARRTKNKVKSFCEPCRRQLFGEGSVWSQRFDEIRYGKMKWSSRMCEKSEEHDVRLTGLMGQFAFDVQSTLRTTLRTEHANPRNRQLFADVLSILYSGNLWRSYPNRKIELNEARATHWSVTIPGGVSDVKVNESTDDAENSFICHLLTSCGHRCNLILATWRDFTSSQTIGRHLTSLLTVTIACVL